MSSSVEEKLADLIKAYKQSPRSFQPKDELITYLETKNLRKSKLLLDVGLDMLEKHRSQLGNREWRLRERVYLASLDCKDWKVANQMMDSLRQKFGTESNRVRCLRGMAYEARGKFTDAIKFYENLESADGVNKNASLRKACCYIGMNKTTKAIEAMRKHLDMYQNDMDSWKMLAKLYLKSFQYELAKFCLEEVLLHEPSDWRVHLLYADILYTLGEVAIAKKYYCQCLVFTPDNLRAMIGLNKCFTKIKTLDMSADDNDLFKRCQKKIKERVRKSQKGMDRYLDVTLQPIEKKENAI